MSIENETLLLCLQKNPQILKSVKDILLMRARYGSEFRLFTNFRVSCVQSLRTEALELEARGFDVFTEIPTERAFDLCIYYPTSQKEENLYNFARIFRSLRVGGTLLCVLPNALGASRFEQEQTNLFGNIQSFSKNKCRAFWSIKEQQESKQLNSWLEKGGLKPVEDTSLFSHPGVFGWAKVDVGSKLLAQLVPAELGARGADFGCGYGYLTYCLLQRNTQCVSVTLFDAESLALRSAEHNLRALANGVDCRFRWLDICRESISETFDWILMNPPFHAGKRCDPQIGYNFVRKAASSLRVGGVLYMVANVKLQYEEVLKENFSSCQNIGTADGFKVFKAIK